MIAITGAAIVAGTPDLRGPLARAFAATPQEIVTYPVRPATLTVTVNEKGSLESAKNEDVQNEVEGTTSIIFILPEGTRVKKGDKVCELDSATLKDTHKNQMITTAQAEASYQQARLTREVAEVAVKEYEEGTYKQDLETILGEIALAESDVTRSRDRLDWSTKMHLKGYVSEAQKLADKSSLQKAEFSLEQAQTKKAVLLKYTRDKTLLELRSDVKKAESDELAKKSTWSLEKDKEDKLVRQIKNCLLLAPGDGLVVYANDPNRFGGQNSVQIEEGAQVRERQKIFSLPDITQMRVNTKVHESMVDRVTKGLRARVRVDAFAQDELTGTVQSVAPLPDANSFFGSDIKVYTTQVAIENGPTGLRPGMTAQVEILISQLPNVLAVPVQAILEFKNKDYLYVRNPVGGFDRREVTLGISNDKLVEIKKGIQANEEVAMTPTLLLSSEEKREAFGSGAKDASKKDWGADAKGAGPDGKGGPATKGDPAKGGPEGKGDAAKKKGARKGAGMGFMAKFQKISPEDREKMKTASEAEKKEILKKAGFTDDELQQLEQMKAGGGFGGGRPGGGGPPQ